MNFIAAIIQARMGSTRLPGKVLMSISGKTMLERVIEGVKKAKQIDFVIVATSEKERDYPIVELCERCRIPVYRGNEIDVLDRYYKVAINCNIKTIVRITADCPMINSYEIDKLIRKFNKTNADFVSNGIDIEIIKREALERAWQEAYTFYDREHVTNYIVSNNQKFTIIMEKDKKRPKLSVDTIEELEFIRKKTND